MNNSSVGSAVKSGAALHQGKRVQQKKLYMSVTDNAQLSDEETKHHVTESKTNADSNTAPNTEGAVGAQHVRAETELIPEHHRPTTSELWSETSFSSSASSSGTFSSASIPQSQNPTTPTGVALTRITKPEPSRGAIESGNVTILPTTGSGSGTSTSIATTSMTVWDRSDSDSKGTDPEKTRTDPQASATDPVTPVQTTGETDWEAEDKILRISVSSATLYSHSTSSSSSVTPSTLFSSRVTSSAGDKTTPTASAKPSERISNITRDTSYNGEGSISSSPFTEPLPTTTVAPDQADEDEDPDQAAEDEDPDQAYEDDGYDQGAEDEDPDQAGEDEDPDKADEDEDPDQTDKDEDPDQAAEDEDPDQTDQVPEQTTGDQDPDHAAEDKVPDQADEDDDELNPTMTDEEEEDEEEECPECVLIETEQGFQEFCGITDCWHPRMERHVGLVLTLVPVGVSALVSLYGLYLLLPALNKEFRKGFPQFSGSKYVFRCICRVLLYLWNVAVLFLNVYFLTIFTTLFDVFDVYMDFLMGYRLEMGEVINKHIYRNEWVINFIFTFAFLGMIKVMISLHILRNKSDRVSLFDAKNLCYCVGFLLEDCGEMFLEYFYIENYLSRLTRTPWFLLTRNTIYSVLSVRLLFWHLLEMLRKCYSKDSDSFG